MQFAERDYALPEELLFLGSELCNYQAWQYVVGPEKDRDLKKALTLVQKAARLDDENWQCLYTLGIIHYRLEHYAEAERAFQRSQEMDVGNPNVVALFFLAMSHGKNGERAKAQENYDQAVKWVEKNEDKLQPDFREQLRAFQAEAKAILDGTE
jgi:tetratricopeptide (TPR) repeat protein